MRTMMFSLLALGACTSAGYDPEEASSDALLSVDNQSEARLVLVSDDGNWNHDADTKWFVDCGGNSPDVVTVTPVDGELVIRQTDKALASACHVDVQGRDVKEIRVTGNGDLLIEGRVDELVLLDVQGDGEVDIDAVLSEQLELVAHGNADIDIGTLRTPELLVDLSGNPTVSIGGESADAVILSNGSGELQAGDLILATLHIEMTGSGDATVHVTDFISGSVTGSSTLEVIGGPEGGVDESGSAEVTGL